MQQENPSRDLNPFQVIQVTSYMEQQGRREYRMLYNGPDSIWVYYGPVNMYFIFDKDCQIVDIQVD